MDSEIHDVILCIARIEIATSLLEGGRRHDNLPRQVLLDEMRAHHARADELLARPPTSENAQTIHARLRSVIACSNERLDALGIVRVAE